MPGVAVGIRDGSIATLTLVPRLSPGASVVDSVQDATPRSEPSVTPHTTVSAPASVRLRSSSGIERLHGEANRQRGSSPPPAAPHCRKPANRLCPSGDERPFERAQSSKIVVTMMRPLPRG